MIDLDLQSPAMNCQSVLKIEWKQTDGRTNGRTYGLWLGCVFKQSLIRYSCRLVMGRYTDTDIAIFKNTDTDTDVGI